MSITKITAGYWHERLEVNAANAIFHQWDQLESAGCIQNFRIAAGEVEGFREGWFFADSDAYKWLEAATRIYATHPSSQLFVLMNDFITLLGKAQRPDGYIFTYNQIHFPDVRWTNLQIEHELYCHGHLIEAGISHLETTQRTDLFEIARRSANRIVQDFLGKSAEFTPGHEEIEIALLRLHRVSEDGNAYLEMAQQFLEQRGRSPRFGRSIFRQNSSVSRRGKIVLRRKREYITAHPEFKPYELPPGNITSKPATTTLRWFASALSGKYFQQHTPVRKQTIPVGHAVRFAYLETALTMLAGETSEDSLLPTLEKAWEHMVMSRMYITGGIGSLPGLEGFGNDYELNPEYAYAETCAALASLFWNWEMVKLTGNAKYSDLFEWQLYNAASVGMGLNGSTYLYNNPLTCHGEVTRKPWYAVPCCPSNLSRTWANLGKYIYSSSENGIFIHQYICSTTTIEAGIPVTIRIETEFPWNGKVLVHINPSEKKKFKVAFRLPSWSRDPRIKLQQANGLIERFKDPMEISRSQDNSGINFPSVDALPLPASGFDPRESRFITIDRCWSPGDLLEIYFDMSIKFRRAHPKVKGHQCKVTVTRGPLVYCLESSDNPGLDIFNVKLDTNSVQPDYDETLLGGIMQLKGRTTDGQVLTFIPYHLWGNRGPSQMTVWVNA